jgi:hypothetical protein
MHITSAGMVGNSIPNLLLTAIYANLRKAEGHFDIKSLSLRTLSPHQSLQLLLAHGVAPLENAHGLGPTGRHNPEIIMPGQSPMVYGGMPQIVKDKVLYPGRLIPELPVSRRA